MTDDPDELVNLLDKKFPQRQTTAVINIFTEMNTILNSIIPKYCDPLGLFKYFIPDQVTTVGLVQLINAYGTDYPNYTREQMFNAVTMFRRSTLDSY
jgi:hypothetical protein